MCPTEKHTVFTSWSETEQQISVPIVKEEYTDEMHKKKKKSILSLTPKISLL